MLQKKQNDQRSSRQKSAQLTSVIKPSHSFPDLSSLKFLIKSHSTKTRLLCKIQKLHDDNRLKHTRKIKRSFSDVKKKSLSPTSNSKTSHLNSSIEQSDKSSLNPLTNEHRWVLQKTIQSGHDSTKKHSETSLMAKVPSKKSTIFQVLKKSVTHFLDFPLEETHLPHLDK